MGLLLDGLADERNNIRIVMPSGEKLGIWSDSEDRHGVRRVGTSGPTYMRFLVEQRDTGIAEFINVLI